MGTPTIRHDELETKIRFVAPTVAVVDVYSHLVGQKDSFTGQPGADRWIRNTYVVTKSNQQWTVVLQRIADLRSPWYPHGNAFPPAAPVSPAVLESYQGTYAARPDAVFEVLPEGDHLGVKSNGVAGVAIPRSDTEFLYFRDSSDPGNNSFWVFSKAADGTMTLTASGAQNDHPTVYT